MCIYRSALDRTGLNPLKVDNELIRSWKTPIGSVLFSDENAVEIKSDENHTCTTTIFTTITLAEKKKQKKNGLTRCIKTFFFTRAAVSRVQTKTAIIQSIHKYYRRNRYLFFLIFFFHTLRCVYNINYGYMCVRVERFMFVIHCILP